jgi:formylglycine-generating enzyme required for sulfatase activity
MLRRIFLLALLGLTIESCQGALLSDTSEREFPKEITGKDGAPMMLVLAGEFLYGDDNQRISLPAFYMDKYELTVSRYASFLQASGRMQPEYWNQASLVSAGDRPVIGVDWYDAYTYCRQYAKRLPTEQEWEKAARGTDGRKYPWGNDEPSDRYANFGKEWDNLNYESELLTAVGSYEDGKSPFGIYDLAGNVWEWTSTGGIYDLAGNVWEWTSTGGVNHLVKVVRGGSWHDGPSNLRSARPHVVEPSIRTSWTGGFRCVQDGK